MYVENEQFVSGEMALTDSELQAWVESISLSCFGKPFLHEARFNPRLKTTGGRYHLGDHRIEMNPKHLIHGQEVFGKIILHELCHYHLHLEGKGYRHRDRDFKQLLAAVGGLRYAPRLPGQTKPKYVVHCLACGRRAFRQRQMQVDRYRCAQCGGRLKLEQVVAEQLNKGDGCLDDTE
jgi:SprT-like protein